MQGTHFRVASGAPSTLVSSTQRLPRLLLSFYIAVLSYLGTLYCIVTFFVIVEKSDMTQVLTSCTGNVGNIDTNNWDGVYPGLLVI